MQKALRRVCVLLAIVGARNVHAADTPGIVASEFVFDRAPVPSCHAGTLAETASGLVAAWFGGTREGHPDVGIWFSRQEAGRWTTPIEVANGETSAGEREPCWNPVLYQVEDGPLLLFYKVSGRIKDWRGMLMRSIDAGRSWSAPEPLPAGILGPIKNKPIMLGKTLVCPSSTEHAGWRVHVEFTGDLGHAWTKTPDLDRAGRFEAIQPTLLLSGADSLYMLCRSQQDRILKASSTDGGRSWSPLASAALPNPNSGIDAVTLGDGRALLVYNHTARGRSPLNVAVSTDGSNWEAAAELEREPGEFSYPAVVTTRDGLAHVLYTWKRVKMKHVTLDPAKFSLRPIQGGAWPPADAN